MLFESQEVAVVTVCITSLFRGKLQRATILQARVCRDGALYLQYKQVYSRSVHYSFRVLSVTGCFPPTDVSSTTVYGNHLYSAKDAFALFPTSCQQRI